MITDKHTNTHADTLITILRSPVGGGVVNIRTLTEVRCEYSRSKT